MHDDRQSFVAPVGVANASAAFGDYRRPEAELGVNRMLDFDRFLGRCVSAGVSWS
jgi:hypothetical protein